MENTIYDEVKGVYRVTHANGSFDTYTPAQYRELSNGVVPVVEEEEGDADIIIDVVPTEVVVTQEVLDENPELIEEGLKVGEIGVVTDDTISFSNSSASTDESITTDETNTQA